MNVSKTLLVAFSLCLPGCASQQAYQGYLDASKGVADAYYNQRPLVAITCQPTCTFSSLEVRAPLAYQAPQQITNENTGIVSAFANILAPAVSALGLRRPGQPNAADVIRAAGEAYKTPNVTTTTTTANTSTTNTSTNTTSSSYNPSTSTTSTVGK